jgi:hypothetical protein
MNQRLVRVALRVLLSLSLYYQVPSQEDIAALRASAPASDQRPLDELARDVILDEMDRSDREV